METDADIFRVEVHTSKIRSSVVRIAITKKSDFSDKRYMFRRFQRKSRTQSQPETGITVTGSNLENYLGVRKFLPDRLPSTNNPTIPVL